ncbi:MAG TPA: hypothetical protein VN850_08145, partial [Candidatus Acidoferrales bacterium]|nr:hypothetical protein [Candidatus Acidoferrales bacterium]
IPLLVQFFVKKYNQAYSRSICGLTRRAQTLLLQHPWPGNVSELENVISSAAITTSGDFIDLADLPENLQRRGQRTAEGAEWQPLCIGRSSQGAYPTGAGDVHGKPIARRASVRDRAN